GVLAVAFAVTSFDEMRAMSPHFEVLPIGLVILVTLFVVYAWTKTNELAELRGLVRGIEQGPAAGQNNDQFDQLFSLISRSQQGYRDLIDTFEDLLFSMSLDGNILTVNRSFADLIQHSFAEVIGRQLNDFFELPESSGQALLSRWLPNFMEKRRWTGVVRARVKKTGEV